MKLKILAILVSCLGVIAVPISLIIFNTDKPKTEKEMVDKPVERINKIDDEDGLYIYEVDGHLYLCLFQGGIIHMESCPCKTR